VLALFVQQPVSGAAFPPAFAPDSVRWLTDISPLRYMVEGVRNLLIGGSTTPEMAWGLALLAGAGLLLVAGGIARLAFIPGKQHMAQPEAIA
jgi:ABC-type polysaccharide/polyol phosphate export permease